MTFRITINTDNAAFEGAMIGPEIVNILQELSEPAKLDKAFREGIHLYDSNGNKVGSAYLDH